VVLGKGLSEQKAPLAAILLALRSILAAKAPISGQVVFLCCVSGETGRHDAIRSIIEATGARAEMAVLNGTGNRISLGNRGRVDVTITVHGSPGHSSRPASACNAITGAIEVIRRLDDGLRFTAEISAIANTVNGAKDPASGKPWRVEVMKGPFMYPSLVSESSTIVGALTRASHSALGVEPEMFYQTNAFDQGYLNHIGIEACTYGPGEEKYAHTDLDMASVDRTRDAAKVYAALIIQQLTLA
jgi:acetylornithine deacetylase/succinyl-diaminopimelate desuccinylase-like protein